LYSQNERRKEIYRIEKKEERERNSDLFELVLEKKKKQAEGSLFLQAIVILPLPSCVLTESSFLAQVSSALDKRKEKGLIILKKYLNKKTLIKMVNIKMTHGSWRARLWSGYA